MSNITRKAAATVEMLALYGVPASVAGLVARDLLTRQLGWTSDERALLAETAAAARAAYERAELRLAAAGRTDLSYEDAANAEADVFATMGMN